MSLTEAQRLKELERENTDLKHLLADQIGWRQLEFSSDNYWFVGGLG